jgi:hypothetical protein
MVREFFISMHDRGDAYASERWTDLMEALFVFDDPEQQEVWDKEASYCRECIVKFFEARFPKWWFAKRNSGA